MVVDDNAELATLAAAGRKMKGEHKVGTRERTSFSPILQVTTLVAHVIGAGALREFDCHAMRATAGVVSTSMTILTR